MILKIALDSLKNGPKPLRNLLKATAEYNDIAIEEPAALLLTQLSKGGPNGEIRNALALKIHQWDNESAPTWPNDTPAHSPARRARIYELLKLSNDEVNEFEKLIPRFTDTERAIVIAEAHEDWLAAKRKHISWLYWDDYKTQLLAPKGSWKEEAVSALEASTDEVLSRISDPTRKEIYPVKGLVVGYVQSGKTAHFAGVIAKAVDAGYRLVIVLAGTMNILRRQTQRRIDKELVGRELLPEDEYGQDSEWQTFVSHGDLPSRRGSVDWERLTGLEEDYKTLKHRLGALGFKEQHPGEPFNSPANLMHAPARLIVIKKIPKVVDALCKDLKALRKKKPNLDAVPTLIIDDESDQASINTIDQSDIAKRGQRTSTNKSIISLLEVLPRAQYVGYTATPFANVFINPADAADLFPKDFIVSLPRPLGYMGASDFYDFDTTPNESGKNERDLVRNIKGEDSDNENLAKAIDSFVLAGALKLYRHSANPKKYRFRHHTMLVHHSAHTVVHKNQASAVSDLFLNGQYLKAAGKKRLEKLFREDFQRVWKSRGEDLPFPHDFSEILPHIGGCLSRINDGKQPVLIVNGENNDDTPDFDSAPVWKILVGGAKLSRGYTVEGLTTTYYRRVATAADTLMQMGRWFGFRHGYSDLVRLFIGRDEAIGKSGKNRMDLYAAFGAICRDEEAFRRQLTRYKGKITPKQIPPLVMTHLDQVPPTAKNKMYNAELKFLNFGGDWKEKTIAASEPQLLQKNQEAAIALLASIKIKKDADEIQLGGKSFDAFYGIATRKQITDFLTSYIWTDDKSIRSPFALELAFMSGIHGDPCIDDWLVLLPQLKSGAERWEGSELPKMSVVNRKKASENRFSVYSEPLHRAAATYVADVTNASEANEFLKRMRKSRRAVLVMYRVRPDNQNNGAISIGFGVQFPNNQIISPIAWGVIDPDDKDAVVVNVK